MQFNSSQQQTVFSKASFAYGTRVQTDRGLVPIQDIQVGDLVLSRDENGVQGTCYKPVVKTFVEQQQELWLIIAVKHWDTKANIGTDIDIDLYEWTAQTVEILTTKNHLIAIVGRDINHNKDVFNFPQPCWKHVHELERHDIVITNQGEMFYIDRAQPLYQFATETDMDVKPTYMWYQYHYYDLYNPESYRQSRFNEQDFIAEGRIYDVARYHQDGHTDAFIKSNKGDISPLNSLVDEKGEHIPFTDTVYSLEVEDDHTYFVTEAGIWVHSPSKPKY